MSRLDNQEVQVIQSRTQVPRCFHSPEWPTGAHGTWNFSVMPTGVDLDATQATLATTSPQTEIPQSWHSTLCSPRKDYGWMKWGAPGGLKRATAQPNY